MTARSATCAAPQPRQRLTAWQLLAFAGGCLLVFGAYWIGLRGPLLLDDTANLAKVLDWLDGNRSWQSAVLDNQAGFGGRPLAMASFLLDAAWWGRSTWHFKLTNLLLHLACGIALMGLYRQLLQRDPRLAGRGRWPVVLLALAWLALPIHVSSVLYLVQRMAILSALFGILALHAYVLARTSIDRGSRGGLYVLWLVVPLLTLLASASKENGALVPLMAFAIELAYFRPASGLRRPPSVRWFFLLALALPSLFACGLLLVQPERWLSAYALRDFTLAERLLSEARVLWDYVAAIVLPQGPRLGVFHDNFPKSEGLFSPLTTAPAIAAWIAAAAAAWRVRVRHPSILAGLLIFVGGHAMESSLLPLELYFEHRNYLPSIGVLLALAGLLSAAAERMTAPSRLFRMGMAVAVVCILLAYVAATHGRARTWSSWGTLYAQELRFNPDSPRMHSDLAAAAMEAHDLPAALAHIAAAENSSPPDGRITYSLWRLLAYCEAGRPPPAGLYAELGARARGAIGSYAMNAWDLVVQRAEQGACPGLDARRLVGVGRTWVDGNTLPGTFQESWRTRYNLARLLASQGHLAEAARQGDHAWRDSGFNNGVGLFLFQVNASLGRHDACRLILSRLEKDYGKGDYRFDNAIVAFRRALADGSIAAPVAPVTGVQ